MNSTETVILIVAILAGIAVLAIIGWREQAPPGAESKAERDRVED